MTGEFNAILAGDKLKEPVNPIRRIATVDEQHVLKGAAQLFRPNRTNHAGLVEHILWSGQQQGAITNYEVAGRGIGVILNKVIDNEETLQEFYKVSPEKQLAYLITYQRRELMMRSFSEAYITFEFEMDFLRFYDRQGIHRKKAYAKPMPDFRRWEFEGEEEAVIFGKSFNTFIASSDFVSRVRPAIEANAKSPLTTEEVVESLFGFFMLNHIFDGSPAKRGERKVALERLGLPQGLSSAQVDYDSVYAPIGQQIGRYLTNLRGGFIRTRQLAEIYCGR